MEKSATKKNKAGSRNTPDPWLHKLPPQNLEAEESVLSSILIDPDTTTLFDTIELLNPEDFYKSAHQKIFAAIPGRQK